MSTIEEAVPSDQVYIDRLAPGLCEQARHSKQCLLVVAADEQEAYRLEEALRFFAGNLQIWHFPDPETLPYDLYSPHQELISERLGLLYQMGSLDKGIIVTSPSCLMQRLPPADFLGQRALFVKQGQTLNLDFERSRLAAAGYSAVGEVYHHGEYAVRGSILDIYPMGERSAYRIDLFDDVVDSIRLFDPDSQRSSEKIDAIRLLPTREIPLDKDGINAFRDRYRERFPGDIHRSRIFADISKGIAPGGIEYYLPLFFEQTATLFDYLPARCAISLCCDEQALHLHWDQIASRYDERGHDIERPLLQPTEVFLDPTQTVQRIQQQGAQVVAQAPAPVDTSLLIEGAAAAGDHQTRMFQALEQAKRVLFVASSAGRREKLSEALRDQGITAKRQESWSEFISGRNRYGLIAGALQRGCSLDNGDIRVVTEGDLFGPRPPVRRKRKSGRDAESLLKDLNDLSLGTAVVHRDHGVGLYQGLSTLDVGGMAQEFLTLEYRGGDRIYVPVTSLNLIHRYSGGDSEHPPLHGLGSDRWKKTREKAAKRIRDVAAELLEIQARRAASKGQQIESSLVDYERFSAGFPFTETEDQSQAINDVLNDLASPRAMDRVVCGDVGFGKTEVALRAAFVAAQAGKQVCILVPTTLLARQHLQNFQDRFADWPLRVEGLSRLNAGKRQTALLQDLADGKIDIVIGTHRLLQKDIHFSDLGLVIIDEEQRFGVRHKERMKALRAEVDMLTLTATPIPRTLNMSMSGLRDMSIIATPPTRRLAIKTFVNEWENAVIREACQRELKRGGQIYFLHNRVQDIQRIAEELAEIVPEARVAVAHGQMHEREMEQVMLDFYHNRFNLLVATTIIESGIDIPNANTIIINRADNLGLAQLHQLRGRVGRSHHRAYAYLLVADRQNLSRDAEQRLAAIEAMGELGAGFQLATHDLEIRGAGELLGEDQSGQIQEIGFTMYTSMLNRAVRALQTGDIPERALDEEPVVEVDLGVTALLPDDFIPDVNTRLVLYKRINNADELAALDDLKVELIDRFGLLPEATENLFSVHSVRIQAEPLQLSRIVAQDDGVRLYFGNPEAISPEKVIRLIQSNPREFRLHGDKRLDIQRTMLTLAQRNVAIGDVLTQLTAEKSA
ncbi:MAG: transcription-repair coupling factor [Oceanococcus sp.]